jgi:phosphatidylinositol alpha-mannosyltransferase
VKVAVVCPYDLERFGGVQDQATKLCEWLNEAGHDAWLVGPGTAGPEGSRLVGPVTVVTANGAATPITLSPAAWNRTIEAVSDADVVHIHEPFMPVVSQAATAAKGPAKVGTFHADPSRTVRRLYRVGGPILRRVANRLTLATAVSPVAAGALAGLVDVTLVPNGLNTADYAPGEKVPQRVAFLGRDDPRKGLGVLLAAWPRVREAIPSAELVVAGQVEATERDGVRYVGRVSEQDKRELLASASVFCAPNTGGESFGIILAEAMASGCALIASGLPGFVHVAGDAAAFVKRGDAVGLATALISVMSDEGKREALATAGLARARRFDREAVLGGYLDAYEAALRIQTA